MKLFFKKINKLNKGFTLVETLVAIAIFTASIVALMSVLASGISDTTYAKTKMTATYLAQEGIEYMRNMRDDYVLYSPAGWNDFTTSAILLCVDGTICGFDVLVPQTLFSCPADGCSLYYDSGTGQYGPNGDTDSGFKRIITIDNNYGSDEIKVTSTVSWKQGSGNYNISFSENLFNWY